MSNDLIPLLLLISFGLSILLAGKSLLELAFGNHRWPAWVQFAFAGGALMVAAILGADGVRRLEQEGSLLALLMAILACGAGLLSLPPYASTASLPLPARELLWRPAAWLLMLWNVGACGWSATRFYDAATPRADELPLIPRPELEPTPWATAVSDRGRPIRLFRIRREIPGWPDGFQPITPALKRMVQTVIRREGPSAESNCHGWVFTDGKFLLEGSGVQTILDDNGYEPCDDPRPGDLIVYWSGRYVIHTGLVSGVLTDGTVLIESKWNLQERFLHRPEDQPYSREFTYYRTSRGSHAITLQEIPEPAE